MRSTLLLLLLAGAAFGQRLSLGIIGGGSLTESFQTRDVPTGSASLPFNRYYASSRDWILGPTMELHLLSNVGIEVDGLYRKLHFTMAGVFPDGSLTSVSPAPVVTWQFPVLAKYRFRRRNLNPIVEVGPSFRTTGNLNGTNPSHYGFTAGFGAEIHLQRFTIAPVVRYTRWATDDVSSLRPSTNPNQVELLVGCSRSSDVRAHPFGRRFSVGAVVGATLEKDLPNAVSTTLVSVSQPDGSSVLRNGVATYSGLRTFVAGPAVEIALPGQLSVEVDAIYHPLRYLSTTSLDGTVLHTERFSQAITWEFPVLAKYRFGKSSVRPLVELGPSFRLPQQVNSDLSTTGITAGAGVEFRIGALKVAPALRYTHWSSDQTGVTQNQATLLVGISF
jgi:hypothetical protein